MSQPKIKRRVGKYKVGRTIGEGTFAKVKFARNSETGEPVALKILDKEKVLKHKMAEQIKREIATMKLIKHPNVVQLFEAEELRKSLWAKNVPANVYVGMRYWHPFTEEAIEQVMIFFSAHGVPLAYVEEAGDPYKAEMEECVDLIMEELEKRKISNAYTLAYQVNRMMLD